jgi:hypothetical protein
MDLTVMCALLGVALITAGAAVGGCYLSFRLFSQVYMPTGMTQGADQVIKMQDFWEGDEEPTPGIEPGYSVYQRQYVDADMEADRQEKDVMDFIEKDMKQKGLYDR